MPEPRRLSAFARYAWAVLAWNVAVVLWGALVRATGAGAGCGNHWPRCNGEVIPPSPSVQTLIEFTHRLMTGADGFMVLALVVLAWRLHPRGSPVRTGAALAAVRYRIQPKLDRELDRMRRREAQYARR